MINNSDISQVNLSTTNKDFYQIWEELIDTASKISERWSPGSTNETDPGIVLLKVLTAVADKLNYNVDKNILEAFMPSAAQLDSMYKLCSVMGYNIKYYQSATTDVTVGYVGDAELGETTQLILPKFTPFTNVDNDIVYISVDDDKYITADNPNTVVSCIQGEIMQCETENDNIISMAQIDDNQRYYLPEAQIAENGIFIYNYADGVKSSTAWERVANLNTQGLGKNIYKFGFDNNKSRPYVQFASDISSTIKDGLEIYYIRTSGSLGNISARTISTFTVPSDWKDASGNALTADSFSVYNGSASLNGSDPESIDSAYNNYKKEVGTFDTLVTCRDYMNKIYELMEDVNTPYVSNAVVTDIRDDINNAYTLCTFGDYGIYYSARPEKESNDSDRINHFDLILYPFKTVKGLNSKTEYESSFKFDETKINQIKTALEDYKTISHNIRATSSNDDITCIKNYLQLNARIVTNYRITSVEELEIKSNIKAAIYKDFNLRNIDFGEEIPFESILSCIENADERIKTVSLEEPTLLTWVQTKGGEEYDIGSKALAASGASDSQKKLYNKLALQNILAGRVEMFNYNTNFSCTLTEAHLPNGTGFTPEIIYPDDKSSISTTYTGLYDISSECPITYGNIPADGLTLGANEYVQFRSQNLTTEITYPCYVNYYIHLNKTSSIGIPARMQTIGDFIGGNIDVTSGGTTTAVNAGKLILEYIANNSTASSSGVIKEHTGVSTAAAWNTAQSESLVLYTRSGSEGNYTFTKADTLISGTTTYYGLYIATNDASGVAKQSALKNAIKYVSLTYGYKREYTIYQKVNTTSSARVPGYLIDSNLDKYYVPTTFSNPQGLHWGSKYFVPEQFDSLTGDHTQDGLGQDAVYNGLPANGDYLLKNGEYLLIEYTPSTTDSTTDTSAASTSPIYIDYTEGTYIRPNFELIDSADLNVTKSFDKTGVTFPGRSVTGLYTLGVKEQIEIRKPSQITIGPGINWVYWMLDGDDTTIPFEDNKYRLKEGEYFYYTDANQAELVYYGFGSVIEDTGGILASLEKSKDDSITAEDILEKGIKAIPWIKCYIESDTKKIIIKEFQYVTLGEGDILYSINPDSWAVNDTNIDNTWRKLKTSTSSTNTTTYPAVYRLAGDSASTNLTALEAGEGVFWEVRSILGFNMGPKLSQTLSQKLDSQNNVIIKDSMTVRWGETESSASTLDPTIEFFNGSTNLGIKLNSNSGEISWKDTAGTHTALNAIADYYWMDNSTGKVTHDTTSITLGTEGSSTYTLHKPYKPSYTYPIKIITNLAQITGESITVPSYGDALVTNYPVFSGSAQLTYDISNSTTATDDGNGHLKVGENNMFDITYSTGEIHSNLDSSVSGTISYKGITSSSTIYTGRFVQSETFEPYLPTESGGIVFPTLKSNYVLQKVADNIVTWYTDEEVSSNSIHDFKIKCFEDLSGDDSGITAFGNNFYKSIITTDFRYTTHELIPNNNIGLIMVYLPDDNPTPTEDDNHKEDYPYLTINTGTLKIFNYYSGTPAAESWWSDWTTTPTGETTRYYVKPNQIHIIKLENACEVTLVNPTTNGTKDRTILYGNLDIVKKGDSSTNPNGINVDLLGYQGVPESPGSTTILSGAAQLLEDIRTKDTNHDFYYNCIMDSSLSLNLNPKSEYSGIKYLGDTRVWYDTNNINGKFVVSEIDAETLDDGIVIVNSSKR